MPLVSPDLSHLRMLIESIVVRRSLSLRRLLIGIDIRNRLIVILFRVCGNG